jgi:hypothetical protein
MSLDAIVDRVKPDGFVFKLFPAKWPIEAKQLKHIHLTDEQILELRDYYDYRRNGSAKEIKDAPYVFWQNYFGLEGDNRQYSSLFRSLAGRIIPVNPGAEPTGFGLYLNSGRTNRIIMNEGKRKARFDAEFNLLRSPSSPDKLLSETMPHSSHREKQATAWSLHCDTVVRSQNAAIPWDPKILMMQQWILLVSSQHMFHFGAEFPVIFPMEDEAVIPDNLVRVSLHDYHGPTSQAHDSTVDIRSHAVMCAGCEYWKGNDNKYPKF